MRKMLFVMLAVLLSAVGGVDAQTAVTPPAGVEQKEYSFFGIYHEPGAEETTEESKVKVAVSGTDIYLQMPNPVNGLAWIKGTVKDTIATFPCQYIGVHGGTTFYMTGRNSSDEVGPVVFSYSESMIVMADQYLQFSDDLTGKNVYGYFNSIIINQEIPDDDVVQVPAGLKTETYQFVGNKILTDQQGNYSGYQETKFDVKVGFAGADEVYVQGLCSYIPDGWVKGTLSDGSFGDKTATFKAGQCYGKFGNYQLYLMSNKDNVLTDMVFTYDPQTRTFSNEVGYYLVLSLQKTSPAVIEMYMTSKMAPKSASGIDAQKAGQTATVVGYTDLQGRKASAQTRGIVLQQLRMADGTMKTLKQFRK